MERHDWPSKKRPGSDSFSREADGKKQKANTPRPDKVLSPTTPPSEYSAARPMPPPDPLSSFWNGASNGRGSISSAPSPVNTNDASKPTVARSSSRSSTPQQGVAPAAPIGQMITTASPSAIGSAQNSGSIFEKLQEFAKAFNDVGTARGELDLARKENILTNLQNRSGGKARAKHAWSTDAGEIHESRAATLVKEKEAQLQYALATQNTVTQAFASALSALVAAPSTNTTTVPSDIKQLLDQKENELRKLQAQVAKLSTDFADLKAQNTDTSFNILKRVDDLRFDQDKLGMDYDRLKTRVYDLEEDSGRFERRTQDLGERTMLLEAGFRGFEKRIKGLEEHTKHFDNDVEPLHSVRTRHQKMREENDGLQRNASRQVSTGARPEAQKQVPADIASRINTVKQELQNSLRKMEVEMGTKHTKLEQDVSRQVIQLKELATTVVNLKSHRQSDQKLMADLNAGVKKLEARFEPVEQQLLGVMNVADQVKLLEEHLATTNNGAASTPESSNEMYSLESHELALEALQKKVHSMDGGHVQKLVDNFEDFKTEVEGQLEATNGRIDAHHEDALRKIEGVHQRLEKTAAAPEDSGNRMGPIETKMKSLEENYELLASKVEDMSTSSLPKITSKLNEISNRVSSQSKSPSPLVTNGNLNGQAGASSQLPQGQNVPTLTELTNRLSNLHQHVIALRNRVQTIEALPAKIDRLEMNCQAAATGVAFIDERMNNLTTDQMVAQMVEMGLPIWQRELPIPTATEFKTQVENSRREMSGIRAQLAQNDGNLQRQVARIDDTVTTTEQTVIRVEQVSRGVSQFQTETKNNADELKKRLEHAERDLGTIEPILNDVKGKLSVLEEKTDSQLAGYKTKLLDIEKKANGFSAVKEEVDDKLLEIEKKADGSLLEIARLQNFTRVINQRSARPADLPDAWKKE